MAAPAGRKIGFVANGKVAFGTDYKHAVSLSYNLAAGEIELSARRRAPASSSPGVPDY